VGYDYLQVVEEPMETDDASPNGEKKVDIKVNDDEAKQDGEKEAPMDQDQQPPAQDTENEKEQVSVNV
jgi:hypothetical protein